MNKSSTWCIIKETLSDGSIAFNVTNGRHGSSPEIVLYAVDEAAAIRVAECLNKDTV